ncbi:hypothetical protein [Streptomyces sp. NPDC056672]
MTGLTIARLVEALLQTGVVERARGIPRGRGLSGPMGDGFPARAGTR